MQDWFPSEMECIRTCYRCINCCDRIDIRGRTRDLLQNDRKGIRQRFDDIQLRCMDILQCAKGSITVVDVFWLNNYNSVRDAINEIIQIMNMYYLYDGCSEIFRNGTKVYETDGIHLYFQFLGW